MEDLHQLLVQANQVTSHTGPKRYHITIQRGPYIQHFLQSYTNKQWEEICQTDEDGENPDWEIVFRCNDDIPHNDDTDGADLDMDHFEITEAEYKLLMKQHGSWTWVCQEGSQSG